MEVEFYESYPSMTPIERLECHHVLINLKKQPLRVENWRGPEYRDFLFCHNEIVVTPADYACGWRWHDTSVCVVLMLDPDKLRRFAEFKLGRTLTSQQLLDVPQLLDPELAESALQLLDALRSRASYAEVVYETMARVFVIQLLDRYGEFEDIKQDNVSTAVPFSLKPVLDYIGENFARPISIEDIASLSGLSTSHFSRVFKRMTGQTPHGFLMQYRVAQAQQSLAATHMPMIEIAYGCGFADQPHFSKLFKQFTGETPRSYRMRMQQNSTNM